MSSAHAAPGAAAHDAHDVHAFDGEPVKTLPPDEPLTPGWLTILGVLLFVGGAVFFVVTGDSSAGSDGAQPAQAIEPVAPAALAAPTTPGVRQLTPEQVRQLKKQIEGAKGNGAMPQGAPPSPPAAAR